MRRATKKPLQRATCVMATLLFIAGAGCPSARSSAQAPTAPRSVPDLTEIWKRRGPIEGRPRNGVPVGNARAIGFSEAFDEVLLPGYDCSPVAIPVLFNDAYNFEIIQQTDRVIMRYEKEDIVRTVWLDGHNHPAPGAYDFTIQGHSTGRYEGSQLVIVTTKFVFDPRGMHDSYIPSSTQKTVTERYWREGDRLKMESVTEDPLVLREPYRYHFEWDRSEIALTSYDCSAEVSGFARQFQPSKYKDLK